MSKLALLIGINYKDTSSELKGCINDVNNMKTFLITQCDYKEENIKILTDNTTVKPTAMNILNEIGRLIIASYHNKSDQLFIHYSGHGTYIADQNGDEKDNRDEAIVPLDYKTAGLITDDVLHDYFSYLPTGCNCVCLFDCCHSGTILDLKYNYIKTDENDIENEASDISSNVIMISGCRDIQTSADAFIDGNWAGAMTVAFLETMKKFNNNVTCFNLLKSMREYLEQKGYQQYPQICSSRKLYNTSIFTCNRSIITPYMTLNNKEIIIKQ